MTNDELLLIALPTSPFAARVQIQILHKELEVRIAHPPRDVTPAEHGILNPFRKTPILQIGNDAVIESGAIAEYLEDRHPSPCMRGANALEAARIRAFIRAVDLYLYPLMFQLRALTSGDPALPHLLTELHQILSNLEDLMGQHKFACSDQFNLADSALVPACFYLDFFLSRQNIPDIRLQHDVLKTWWQAVLEIEPVTEVLAGLNKALKPA